MNQKQQGEEWSKDEKLMMILSESGVKDSEDFKRIFDYVRQLLAQQRKEIVEICRELKFREKDQSENMKDYQNRKIGYNQAINQIISNLEKE